MAALRGCEQGHVQVRGQRLQCELQKTWVSKRDTGEGGRSHQRVQVPPFGQHGGSKKAKHSQTGKWQYPNSQSNASWGKSEDASQAQDKRDVGSWFFGELRGLHPTQPTLRFITCSELPERMRGKDVFIVPNDQDERVWTAQADTPVSFKLREQPKTGRPQAEEVMILSNNESRGKGNSRKLQQQQQQQHPRGRRGLQPNAAFRDLRDQRHAKENDARLDLFIELNELEAQAVKSLQNCSKALQARVIDHWKDSGLKIDDSGDMLVSELNSAVLARLEIEREQEGRRSSSRKPSSEERNFRSRSRSSARRSRSDDSSSRSHSPAREHGEMRHNEGLVLASNEDNSEKQRHQSKTCRSRSRSRNSGSRSGSRSRSRSLTPLKRDQRAAQGQHAAEQHRESADQDAAAQEPAETDNSTSSVIELSQLPSLKRGILVTDYLAEMLMGPFSSLPDFDASAGGQPIQVTWEKAPSVVCMQMQSSALAESAARAVDALQLFGQALKVRVLSKEEAERLRASIAESAKLRPAP
eukprot:TRINITY_DN21076_c1_g1_i1.p1 TRINITY_DN21076_c1_g1~~TRINITY_DN21076_c1_g1_i1.p1  ORF type:complete len:598 (+),score=111.39 TRINITY_DN21076_c1_g1_i1:217-1794(+)